MTDRYSAFLVVLEHDIRDDDTQEIIDAIKMIKGVLDVQPHIADQWKESVARSRLKQELMNKIIDILQEI